MDWTCSKHNLGIGLPVRTKNEPGWFYKGPILTNKNIRPSTAQMKSCNEAFCQLLRMRCVFAVCSVTVKALACLVSVCVCC